MSVVVDSSCVVAALLDRGDSGTWARRLLRDGGLVAPHLLPVEVMSVLRRGVLAGRLGADAATLALQDLMATAIELHPFEVVASRAWELRATITPYDAWYVATAELFDVPLATLDLRLARSAGVQCSFLTP